MTWFSDASLWLWIERGQEMFSTQWPLAVALFCTLHLIASLLGIPGGCTTLNIVAGAVFGFGLGCLIVYPITVASAALSYGAGRALSGRPLAERYQKFMVRISDRLGRGDFLFLVSLRLSPLLPFGLLNFASGWLRIPFGLFISSTTVGIFFDVTLLNSVGAALRMAGSGGVGPERVWLFAIFIVLLLLFWLVRSFLFKQKGQMRL